MVTNAERSSVTIVSTDLDLHLIPADSREEAFALLVVRNSSASPVTRIPIQLSSPLRFERISSTLPHLQALAFTQSPIATDADHTGYAQEAVISLPNPLPPGGSLTLSVLYAGEIKASAARLELIGTKPERAAFADWDAIAPITDASATALRGFGNVLWYPVACPAALFGAGNELLTAIATERANNLTRTFHLHLTVEYVGDPPDSAIFDGNALPLTRTGDSDSEPVDSTRGLATADFVAAAVGYRIPSLFLTAQHAATSPDQLVSAITAEPGSARPYFAAAQAVAPLLTGLLGPGPTGPMLLLDHPGEAFEDAALLVLPLNPNATPATLSPLLVRSLTHAWFPLPGRSSAWLDQGLPEFASLLWIEQTEGREAALKQLQNASVLIALAEPDLAKGAGQPLTSPSSAVYLQAKSATVLWQLRELLGDVRFRQAMIAFRLSLALNPKLASETTAFQHALETVPAQQSKEDLRWFFDDWVYRDRGLPDLTILQVNPRRLPARPGKNSGYLVAVEVRNDGDAVADVPVIVRAASTSARERLRILPHTSASTRILFEDLPDKVEVNDGSVPELRTSTHTVPVHLQP